MPLDAELQPIVDLINSLDAPPAGEQSTEENRAAYAGLSMMFGTGDDTVVAEDESVPGPCGDIPIRWYRPADGAARGGAAETGVIVYFHGGGWVIGSVDTHDPVCRDLAQRCGVPVVSVDYRLAPEHIFPAAVDDCRVVTDWVWQHASERGVDPTRIVVAGDSAGGQLATVVARHWPSERPPLALQVLVYPVTDLAVFPIDPVAGAESSMVRNGEGYVLTLDTMEYFVDNYAPDPAIRIDPDASPLRAESLAGLPPALVITAEYDPLCDEGEAYAARLADAGVPVVATRYDGATHMFLQMSTLGITRRALDEIAGAIRAAVT